MPISEQEELGKLVPSLSMNFLEQEMMTKLMKILHLTRRNHVQRDDDGPENGGNFRAEANNGGLMTAAGSIHGSSSVCCWKV